MRPPSKRKPVVSTTTGSQNIEAYGRAFDSGEFTAPPHELQAFRVRDRFGLSWSTARAVAELAYSAGGVS